MTTANTLATLGNGPAFSAYLASTQTISANTWTKITINTENFDTNSNFDSTTNYRFTPTVAGYYQINGSISIGNTNGIVSIYKNGSANSYQVITGNVISGIGGISTLIYFNGTTDYVELYGYSASTTILSGASSTQFSGAMVRGA